jgi:transposase InsO family protein
MADHGVVCSMSRSGNVWDNAAMERLFSSLKTERTARKMSEPGGVRKADEISLRMLSTKLGAGLQENLGTNSSVCTENLIRYAEGQTRRYW